MKKLLPLLLIGVVLLAAMPGCTRPPENGEVDPTEGEQYANVLLSSEPSVLDVVRLLGVADRSVLNNVLEPLTRIEDGVLAPAGAEDWQVSPDGLTYTFYLRENYWSDGQKVTSADYVSPLKRQADPNNAYAFASDMYCIKNFEAINKGEKDVDELGVEIINDTTFAIHLEYKNVAMLSTIQFYPERADAVEEYGDTHGTEADTVMSCGPFILDEWVHGSELEFAKNDLYWDSENVKLDRFTYKIIPDSNAQLASLENGSLDYLNVSDPDYVERFRQRDDMTEVFLTSPRTVFVLFNCRDDVFQNRKIRQAFSLAVDRETVSEVIYNGLTQPAYGLVPPDCIVGQYNFRDEVEEPLLELKEDHSDLQALLIEGMQELGLGSDPSTLEVTFSWGATTAAARTNSEYYQQMWQTALGVNVSLEFADVATHLANINQGNYQFGVVSWGAFAEPHFQLSRWASGGLSGWVNSEYDALLNEAVQTVDDRERLNLYAQAEEMMVNNAVMAPVAYSGYLRFLYNYMKGVSISPFDTTGMKSVYTEGR